MPVGILQMPKADQRQTFVKPIAIPGAGLHQIVEVIGNLIHAEHGGRAIAEPIARHEGKTCE